MTGKKVEVEVVPLGPDGQEVKDSGDLIPPGQTTVGVTPSGSASQNQVAALIIAAAEARGLNEEQTLAALSVRLLETGLGTNPMTNAMQTRVVAKYVERPLGLQGQ